MIKLKRHSNQPILSPNPTNSWEAAAVFNTGAIIHNDLVHLIYRATDISSNGKDGNYTNSLGYAVSIDGIHFNRLEKPILSNDTEQERRGPEDPRVVKIGDTFYMLYTGYGGRFAGDFRICLATSKNLITWQRQGVLLDEPNKDASLFPEKINDRFVMLHRRVPDIWLAYSQDLINWSEHTIVMKAIAGSDWENEKIGISGPPIKTDDGWFLFYHGVSSDHIYRQGAALLDLNNPSKVIERQKEPIFEPELDWELKGHVNNVVFSCGHVIFQERIFVYYGGADTSIGLATMDYSDISLLN